MATMTNLIEYLLGLESPGGGKVVRFGQVLVRVPLFPAATTVSWLVTPFFNSYASIEYYHRLSPSTVPGTLVFESHHVGMEIGGGSIGTIGVDGFNVWVEITQANPILTTVTNITPVNQFLEAVDFFLLIDSEAAFREVKRLIEYYCAGRILEEELKETNMYLRAIAEATPGAKAVLTPRPSIGRR